MTDTELQKQVFLSFDRGTLLLRDAASDEPLRPVDPSVWTWDERVGAWRCDAIHYATVTRQFQGRLQDDLPQPAHVFWPRTDLPDLRSEQTAALTAWIQAGCRGQIIMPTGTGKTEVAFAAMARTRVATLVMAPVRDLMYQWHRRILTTFGYDAGIVGDSLFNIRPVTVTTYDSAYIHMDKMGAGFGLLIFDEEHHLPGKCRREAAILSTATMRLGLTATPERSDGLHKDLDWLIGPVVYHMPFAKAKGSTLADFDVVRIPVALTDSEQATYDQCSRTVRHFIASRREEHPVTRGRISAKSQAKTLKPDTLRRPIISSNPSKTARPRNSASWRTSSDSITARRCSSSPAQTQWPLRSPNASCCQPSFPTPANANAWPFWKASPKAFSAFSSPTASSMKEWMSQRPRLLWLSADRDRPARPNNAWAAFCDDQAGAELPCTKSSAPTPKKLNVPERDAEAMLTSEHSIVEYRTGRAIPDRLTQKTHRHYLEYAKRMLATYRKGLGTQRRVLHRRVEAVFADEPNCPIRRIQAFCKLLDDASVFRSDPSGTAAKLRLEVFSQAACLHPLVQQPDRLFEHEESRIKKQFAEARGVTWDQMEEALYVDVMAFQPLEVFNGYADPTALLSRYNVAQLQACLYRTERMTVIATEDLKTIVRYAKLARLLHEIERLGPSRYRITFSGPASVLRETRRYGVNFARFLPALLACTGWQMTATLKTPWNTRANLRVCDSNGYTSHLPAPDEFDSRLEESFARKFGPSRDGWQLVREGEILHDRQKTFIPDFVFRHEDGTQVLLEIVGFWTPEYLAHRRETLRHFGHDRILLAVPEKSLRNDAPIADNVLVYKTALKLAPLMAALEATKSTPVS